MYSGGGYYGGSNYDGQYSGRYPNSGHLGQLDENSTIGKLKEEYWLTKQKIIKKFHRKEDCHVVAGDADLDSKLEIFHSIQKTTTDLLKILERYQDRICGLSGEENAMGRFLKNHSQSDKSRAGKMMAAVGKVQSFTAQQRLAIRAPLQRLYQEVETFRHRAIADCSVTLQRMEKARTEYRAALLWMKDVSENLDPDTHKQLEKFRTVQGQVRRTKTRFDKLKVDCIQKIDLLAASRCNMFSNVLTSYQTCVISFLEKNSRALETVSKTFYGYQPYEFSVIKELVDPTKKQLQQEENEQNEKEESPSPTEDLDEVDRLIREIKEIGKGCRSNFRVGPKFVEESKDENELIDEANSATLTETQNGLVSLSEPMRDEDFSKSGENAELKSSDSLVNLFADLGEEASPSTQLNSLDLQTQDISSLNPQTSAGAASDGESLMADDLDNLTLLNEIMGTGSVDPLKSDQVNQSNSSSDLQGLEIPPFMGPTQFGVQGNAASLGIPGSALYSFNQQWNAHFGFASADSMESWNQQLSQMPQQLPQHQYGMQQFGMQAPPSYNAATSSIGDADSQQGNPTKGPKKDLSAWYGMFAELDPLANPDAIGKEGTDEADRNC